MVTKGKAARWMQHRTASLCHGKQQESFIAKLHPCEQGKNAVFRKICKGKSQIIVNTIRVVVAKNAPKRPFSNKNTRFFSNNLRSGIRLEYRKMKIVSQNRIFLLR